AAALGGWFPGQLGPTQPPAGEVLPVEDRFEPRLVGTGDGEDERRDEEGENGRSDSASMNRIHQEAPGRIDSRSTHRYTQTAPTHAIRDVCRRMTNSVTPVTTGTDDRR